MYYFLITAPLLAQAACPGGGQSGGEGQLPGNVFDLKSLNPLKSCDITDLLNKIANGLLIISIPIATIMILVGAFQMLTAAGNPENFEKGKKTILYAAIGLGVLLLAKVIIAILQSVLGVKQPPIYIGPF